MAIGFKSPATSANINNNMASKTVDNTFAGNQTFNGATNTFNNGLSTDTISEKTPTSGVTIDGVLLKDGLTDGVDVSAHAAATTAHGVSGAILGTTDSQTFTNKITDVLGLDGQASTPSNPASGFYKFYAKDDGKAYLLNSSGTETQIGSGSGSGGINYITNYNAESGTAGWSVYKDTAATTPEDGTGQISSPSVTFVSSFNSTYALRGGYGFVLTKLASNCQGEGVSYDFTIDPADQAKMLRCTFDYKYAGTYTDDDLQIWVYNVTNAALIAVTPFKLKNHTMYSDQYAFEFQTAYNSTSYRLIFHVASTSTALYYFAFDNIQLGPQVARGYGSVVTDWKNDWVPTFNTTNTTNVTGKWRRVGDSIQLRFGVNFTGTPSGTMSFNVPSFITVDTSKITGVERIVGAGRALDGGIREYGGVTSAYSVSSNQIIFYSADSAGSGNITTSAPFAWGNTDQLEGEITLPVLGWSAQSQIISTDSANGVVSTRVYKNGTQSLGTATTTKFTGFTVDSDKNGMWDATNSRFNILTPGDYVLHTHGDVGSAANSLFVIGYDKNNSGSWTYMGGISQNGYRSGGSIVIPNLKAGDYIEVGGYVATAGVTLAAGWSTWIAMSMLQGPSQILASEKISARYYGTSSTISNAGGTTINYTTKDYDSHGLYTGSGVFTAKRADYYNIVADLRVALVCTVINADVSIYIYKNGGTLMKTASIYSPFNNSTTFTFNPVVTDRIWLNAGETFQIVCAQQTYGGAVALGGVNLAVWTGN